jgi:hypothetical protein
LWLNVYGEFPVLAYVERKAKPGVWLTRYLDLPGRPPDKFSVREFAEKFFIREE